ncbi:hypothetical protein M3Y97_01007500 [Aphelenchoides bicaudatus]|nr:hypothetical protein M3Y97_01007500 [Aphelenchoides bicaudatus]
MKVFTVPLGDKPPVEKSESPPPGYASTAATPLPMGPEIAPIIVRKSRGYKGILLVMLAVFLMAIFALTLSEIAYNRQRDENFFRLQWAQLKHRLGYNDFGHRIIPVNQGEFEMPIQKELKQEQTTETSKMLGEPSSDSQESSSSASNSQEQQNLSENFARDARLQFLRQILQRIKQNAEQMGFDGTMQVSVIEVEPQQMEFGKKSPSEDPRSDSFLDSFGEFHAPSPFGPPPPSMREINDNSIVSQQGQNGRWPSEFSGFEMPMPSFSQQMNFRPDMMGFRQPEWSMQGQQRPDVMDEQQWAQRRPDGFEIHPKSAEFGSSSPSQEVMGEIYGRKFGRVLQDLIAARIQNSLIQQQQQNPMMQNLVMPMRPSFPIEPQQQVGQNQMPNAPQQNWWVEPQAVVPQSQQASFAQPPPPSNAQEVKPELSQQQPQGQQMPEQEQFGQGFPQPQFPVFVSPEDRIQIEPPNGGASWQPPQQQNGDDKQQMPPHIITDFMPPRAWTHQSESAPAPTMTNPLVEGDSQQQPKTEEEPVTDGHENRIVILKKQPVDGEKHEDMGPSQLSDLPMKELQGQLAAAAAALSAQQNQDAQNREETSNFDELAKQKNMEMQRPSQDSDLFKSIEQPSEPSAPVASQEPTMPEIPETEIKQQPVEPAPITTEHNADEISEQAVDFPAVKFPQASADAPTGPMNDLPEQQQPGIFFQVDEPHQQAQAPQNMAGFA